jgi:uncharacterized protein (DUF427 family)
MNKRILEDQYIGPLASPSFNQGFRWEDSHRRVRVVFAGETVADSKHAMLLHEFGRLPVFYFPIADVRMDMLEATDYHTHSPLKGEASYWTLRVGDHIAEHAAWSYPQPLPEGPQVQGYVAFYWDLMDAWYEEEQRVYAHARDPYKRVDILPSTQHVRVVLGGVTIADTHHPLLLLETGLPIRYYIPEQDIHMEYLESTETTSHCPYKGMANYWSSRIGEKVFKDVVWSYHEPLPECIPIAHYLSFYNERVNAIYVDDELMSVPKTIWSE